MSKHAKKYEMVVEQIKNNLVDIIKDRYGINKIIDTNTTPFDDKIKVTKALNLRFLDGSDGTLHATWYDWKKLDEKLLFAIYTKFYLDEISRD